MLTNWTSQPALEVDPQWGRNFTCDTCAEARCSICGHEPCPCCLNCCDHTDCLIEDEGVKYEGTPEEYAVALKKTHTCSFTPCEKHRTSVAP